LPSITEILIIVAIILAVFVLPKRFIRRSPPVKRAPLKQGAILTGWQRMAILLSILWLSFLALYLKPWVKGLNEWYIYIYAGITPVVLYWGGYWIYRGFKRKGR
jgi:isoprenylcysteine carboxyl methyltransferase (ICMT) family protein YpbQ